MKRHKYHCNHEPRYKRKPRSQTNLAKYTTQNILLAVMYIYYSHILTHNSKQRGPLLGISGSWPPTRLPSLQAFETSNQRQAHFNDALYTILSFSISSCCSHFTCCLRARSPSARADLFIKASPSGVAFAGNLLEVSIFSSSICTWYSDVCFPPSNASWKWTWHVQSSKSLFSYATGRQASKFPFSTGKLGELTYYHTQCPMQ